MGSEILRLFNVLLCISSLDMVLHERIDVHIENDGLHLSFVCHSGRANILEMSQWIFHLSFLCLALL